VGDPQGADQPGFDNSGWKRVTTPYAWNEDSAFCVSIHDLPTGVAWYRKHFRLPASSAGKKIFIEFEDILPASSTSSSPTSASCAILCGLRWTARRSGQG